VDEASSLQSPWLGLFGDADESIPVDDVELLRSTLDDQTTVEHEVVRFADAQHGFNCDQRPSYNPAAAADAWRRTLAWFEAHLG
jgi:carboxymethylenebutenolidase